MFVYPVNVTRLQGDGYERCRKNDLPTQKIKRLYSNWVGLESRLC